MHSHVGNAKSSLVAKTYKIRIIQYAKDITVVLGYK